MRVKEDASADQTWLTGARTLKPRPRRGSVAGMLPTLPSKKVLRIRNPQNVLSGRGNDAKPPLYPFSSLVEIGERVRMESVAAHPTNRRRSLLSRGAEPLPGVRQPASGA